MKITFTKVITVAIIGMVLSVQAAQVVIVANPSTGGGSYTLPVATTSTLGGIMPDGSTITVNASGVASASGVGGGSGTVTGVTCSGTSGVTCASNGSSTAPVLSVGVSGPVPSATTAASASAVPVTGVSGLGTGVQAALQIAKNTAGGPVVTDGSNKLPALDGSQLVAISAVNVTGIVPVSGAAVVDYNVVVASQVAGVATSYKYVAASATPNADGLSSATTTVNVSASSAPSSGQVLTATDSTHATWQTPSASSSTSFNYAVPIINGSGGNITTTAGDITLTTAEPEIFSTGAWRYFQANSITGNNVAAYYWFIGSSTSAGTLCNNTYIPGTNLPTAPASCTAFTAAVVQAFTGTTGEIVVASYNVAANSLGNNGWLKFIQHVNVNNNANNKYARRYWGGTLFTQEANTSVTELGQSGSLQNQGVATKQLYMYSVNGGAPHAAAVGSFTSKDTTSSQVFELRTQKATADDYIMFRMINISTGVN